MWCMLSTNNQPALRPATCPLTEPASQEAAHLRKFMMLIGSPVLSCRCALLLSSCAAATAQRCNTTINGLIRTFGQAGTGANANPDFGFLPDPQASFDCATCMRVRKPILTVCSLQSVSCRAELLPICRTALRCSAETSIMSSAWRRMIAEHPLSST